MGAILPLTGCKLRRVKEGEVSRGQIEKYLHSHACNSYIGDEKRRTLKKRKP